MASLSSNSRQKRPTWPNDARAAIAMTLDNMGEAADLNRNLWPQDALVGEHYSVRKALPPMLDLLKKYDISATYFIESWNIAIYGETILNEVAGAGHEIAWHAWQHEAWAQLRDDEETKNFQRSFGDEGIGQWVKADKIKSYAGFRPPGGIVNGDITLKKCRDFGLRYLSPAAEKAAIVSVGESEKMVILPFKWAMVDAYFYMEAFGGLRRLKGEATTDPQPSSVLVQRYIAEIDKAVEEGGFLSILFHPFLTDTPERLEALEAVLKHVALRRDKGEVWVARCDEVNEFIRSHPDMVGEDPEWDLSSWR